MGAGREWVVIAAVGLLACSETSEREADAGRDAGHDAGPIQPPGCDCRAGEMCVSGTCVALDCGPGTGRLCCEGDVIDPRRDPYNCGACGNRCGSTEGCLDGECACAPGLTSCAGSCVDTNTDSDNCGSCGSTCPDGFCVRGECAGNDCGPAPLMCCGSEVVDTDNDPENCGGCGIECPMGSLCSVGICIDVDCSPPLQCCESGVVDPRSDPFNCGGCGVRCKPGYYCAEAECICDLAECADECVDYGSDHRHCGGCGNACGPGETCAAGVCVDAVPTTLRIDCPSTTFPAGAGAVRCVAILSYADAPDVDVTTAPETTWTLGACAGGEECTNDERPRLVTSGADAGTFVPAGAHFCAASVTSNIIQTISATWRSGATTLTDDALMTTEPAMSLGYRVDPENITVPWLFDAQCGPTVGSTRGGLATRLRMLRTFAGGGVCPVPASGWSISSSAGSVLAVATQSDGSVVTAITGPAGSATTPRAHVLTARVGATEVATTTITVVPLTAPEIHVLPGSVAAADGTDSTPIAAAFLVIPEADSLAFDLSTIGDPANVAPGATGTSPYHWTCAGALDAARESPLYPWTEAECPNTLGAGSSGPFRCAGTAAAGVALLDLTSAGVFRQAAGTGTAGARTLAMSFPYAGAPGAVTGTVTVDIR